MAKKAKAVAKPSPARKTPKKPAKKAAPKQSSAAAKPMTKKGTPVKKAVKAAGKQRPEAKLQPAAPKTPRPKSARAAATPLEGLTVVEVGGGIEAAATGAILANFGARVIKVEPAAGDSERKAEPRLGSTGAAFLMLNRGKESVALDAASKKAKSAYLALAESADIIIDGAGYGVLDQAGVGYKTLSKSNEKLIYAAITGFGQSGPKQKTEGSEINYLALVGALELFGGPSNMPAMPGMLLGPVAAGAMPAVIGVLAALQAQQKTGRGQLVDAAVMDGLIGILALNLADYSASKMKPRYGKGRFYGQYACYQLYPARSSHWLAVGALAPEAWARLCKLIKREDLIGDQYADDDRQQVLIAELTRVFQRKEIREWMEIFEGQEVCVTPLRSMADAAHDEHLIERGTIIPLKTPDGPIAQLGVFPKLSETPGRLIPDVPELGQHTREVLESVGLPKKTVDDLIKSKAAAG